ncbi:Xylitol-binding protein [Austwickia sp. TVS 96-490-7B]|uniref:sugar ABC transporter substrate-binding protein n=1 Tax=Austwickia sp. TVS 96-490-7B TaxID=2830843 RepID=UPI001C5846F1|nr:sugar ABC transporter substrate-binding protein [Austwickia sp. TVS 96-490-7B]MBW3085249.1 Xylitol-binding protein [Austwickia sp. TVS 96-490-7B]
MKHGLTWAGVALAASGLVAGCGSTAAPSGGSAGGASGPAAAGVTYTKGTPIKPKDGKKLKIGVTFAVYDQFLQTVADGIKARAAENGVEVDIVSAEKSTDKQLGQVENFVTQKYDGVIVVPVDTAATGPMTQKATSAEIPLVYVNRKPANLPEKVPYVGSDSIVAGQLEMAELAKQVGNKGNVAVLIGDPANEAATMRTKGCKETAEKNGMKVVLEQSANWERDKALTITENWLQSGQQIDAICSNNDDMALGAIKALKNAGKLDKIKVGGVDATSDALKALKEGDLAVTVFQDAKGQGAGGVDSIVQLYNKEQVPSFVNVPFQAVTKDKAEEFANK